MLGGLFEYHASGGLSTHAGHDDLSQMGVREPIIPLLRPP